MTTQDRNVRATVLLAGTDHVPQGHGILIKDDQIITASHVINECLGREGSKSSRPDSDARVWVTVHPSSPDFEGATVAKWQKPGRSDVATLKLDKPFDGILPWLPEVPQPESLTDRPIRVFVHSPETGSQGVFIDGVIPGLLREQALQINRDPACPQLFRQGQSGALVLDRLSGGGLGMITDVGQRGDVAWMTQKLFKAPVAASPDAVSGSPSWRVPYIVCAVFAQIPSDLSKAEIVHEGLTDDIFRDLRATFVILASDLAALSIYAHWDTLPRDVLDQMTDVLDEWKGHATGPAGAGARDESMKRLRSLRDGFAEQAVKPVSRLMNTDALIDLGEQIHRHLHELAQKHPQTFSNLTGMLVKYERKVRSYELGQEG